MNLISFIEEKYGLKKVGYSLLPAGVNDTYVVDSEPGKYIFRGYHSSHRLMLQIQEEVNLLSILKQHHVSVSYPVSLEDAKNSYAVFLISYHHIRPFSEAELQSVPYLSLGFWLFYMGFHTTHDHFSRFLQPDHLKSVVAFLRHLVREYWNEV